MLVWPMPGSTVGERGAPGVSGAALRGSCACPRWLRPSHMPVSPARAALSVGRLLVSCLHHLPVHLSARISLSICLSGAAQLMLDLP